jgi:hypothetical protein
MPTIEPNRILRRAGGLDETTAKRVAQAVAGYLAQSKS